MVTTLAHFGEVAQKQNKTQDRTNSTANFRRNILIIGDVTAILLSWLLSLGVTYAFKVHILKADFSWGVIHNSVVVASFVIPFLFLVIALWSRGHYTRFKPFWEEYKELTKILLTIVGLVGVVVLSTKLNLSRLWFFTTWLAIYISIPVSRLMIRKWLIAKNRWFVNAILISNMHDNIGDARHLEGDSYLGLKICGHINLYDHEQQQGSSYFPTISLDNPDEVVERYAQPHIIMTSGMFESDTYSSMVRSFIALSSGGFTILPSIKQLRLYGAETYHLFREDTLILRVKRPLMRRIPAAMKRLFDICLSGLLLILLTPFFLVLAYLIRRDGGKATFEHQRVGQYGKHFKCLKFRSMVFNAEGILEEYLEKNPEAKAEWKRDFKLKNDPRITRLGHFLRRSSADELPQLWNVFKGEMSLVGPRPVVEKELDYYGLGKIDYLSVKPGMTGLWQVSGRSDTDYERRVALDSWYVRNWSLWQDWMILLNTFAVVANFKGAR